MGHARASPWTAWPASSGRCAPPLTRRARAAEQLARGAQGELERIDAAIAEAATNWRFDRIAAIDRNILRIAAYELMMEPHTPPSVVIDEAVEMAKRFSEAEAPGFVNGVLDAIKRAVRGEPAGRR